MKKDRSPATYPRWKAALQLNNNSKLKSSPSRERIFLLATTVVVVSLVLYVTSGQQNHRIESEVILLPDSRVAWIFEPITPQPDPEPPFGLSSASIELPSTIITDAAEDLPLFSYPALIEIELMENWPRDETFAALNDMMLDFDPVIRLAALESLATMNHPGIASILINTLCDPDPQLRIAALDAVASQDDATLIPNIEALLYDPDAEVRIAAIDTLSELESEAAVMALASLLSDGDAIVRHHTVNALGEIGGDNAISYLSGARYDPDETIRANAEAILLELGHQADY